MEALALLVFLALAVVVSGATLAASVWLGSAAYVMWRDEQRERAFHDPLLRALGWIGKYRSPFPWHRRRK